MRPPEDCVNRRNEARFQRARCCSSCLLPEAVRRSISRADCSRSPAVGLQLAVLLQRVQGGEQRTRIDMELIVTERGEPLRDAVAVHRLASGNRQNHQVERALGNIELLHCAPLGYQDEA